MNFRISLAGVMFLLLCGLIVGAVPRATAGEDLTTINPDFMITPDEAQSWHELKDSYGPTFSGSPAWKAYLDFLEERLKALGVVDIIHNGWTYDRWYTTEWPNSDNWSLISGGESVRVAHYGAYSGSTGPKGLTAELALYTPDVSLNSLEDKIVVFRTAPHPEPPLDEKYKLWFTLNDYEYRNEKDTFPPLFSKVLPEESVSYDVWWQLRQTIQVYKVLRKSRARGGVVIFNMSYERLAGLYTFPVMPLTQCPTLYVDREAGDKLLADAKAGKTATLKLLASVEPTETYQLIGYLPGKHYGTDQDERILLTTHTDGPALQQDNGALGILGIVQYFSHIPQTERPRTLMVYLDNRHYLPGMERAFAKEDWFAKHPEAEQSIAGLIATEHLGQIEYSEKDGIYGPTGMLEPSFLWTRNDQRLIDEAIRAVKAHSWPRVMVQCVERPGIHGGTQGVWYGIGKIALEWDLPAYATMGTQGAYWSTKTRIEAFDKRHFCRQVATMSQLTGILMTSPME